MGKYGEIAIHATKKAADGTTMDPVNAWKHTAASMFPIHRHRERKGVLNRRS